MVTENNDTLQKYMTSLSEELVNTYFSSKSHINGGEILSFCEIKQINYFIIEQLMRDWQSEMLRLKSPYFEYSSPEVQKALKALMNKLSHHIKINQEDFLPLVEKAVHKTVNLCEKPFQFLKDHYLTYDDLKIEVQQITNDLKYVKLNKEIIERALEGFANDDEINTEDLLERVEKQYVAQKEELFDLDDFLASCDKILTVPEGLTNPSVEEQPKNEDATLTDTPEPHVNEETAEQSVETEENTKEEESQEQPDETIATETSTQDEASEINEEEQQDDNDELTSPPERLTLNDKLKRDSKTTLADTLKKPGITSLKQSLGINQRYTFMKELFGNDADVFNEAIEKTDSFEDYESASNYLIDHYAREYNWDNKEEVTTELFHLLSRKF